MAGPKDWSPMRDIEDRAYTKLVFLNEELKAKYPEVGLSFGYIGNLDIRYDDRRWSFFTQVPIQGTWGLDRMHFGDYRTGELREFAKEAERNLETWIQTRALPRIKESQGGEMSGPKDWSPLHPYAYEVAETIAAISFNLGHSNKYTKAYNAAVGTMGGYVGFYQAGAEMGLALDAYAKTNRIAWGEDANWIATTAAVAEYTLDFMIEHGRLPGTAKERAEIIKYSIARD